jgi:ABC-type phosphate/phosphonate transport system substrate-binding protein
MPDIRFAIATTLKVGARAVADLLSVLGRHGFRDVQPVFAGDYAGLFEEMKSGRAQLAWCPPLVALELERADVANAVATVLRKGRDHYYTALVAHPDSRVGHLADVGRARVGWVSRTSASGYIVARHYIASTGVALKFGSEQFFETHVRASRALVDEKVDVIATYADVENGAVRVHPDLTFARVLGAAGPIPGDVVVTARGLPPERVRAFKHALFAAELAPRGPLAKMMHATGFGPLPKGHFLPLAQWMERAKSAPLRPLVARHRTFTERHVTSTSRE